MFLWHLDCQPQHGCLFLAWPDLLAMLGRVGASRHCVHSYLAYVLASVPSVSDNAPMGLALSNCPMFQVGARDLL